MNHHHPSQSHVAIRLRPPSQPASLTRLSAGVGAVTVTDSVTHGHRDGPGPDSTESESRRHCQWRLSGTAARPAGGRGPGLPVTRPGTITAEGARRRRRPRPAAAARTRGSEARAQGLGVGFQVPAGARADSESRLTGLGATVRLPPRRRDFARYVAAPP